jgi:alkaline phosphatase D
MMNRIWLLFLFYCCTFSAFAQEGLLQSGPMVGHAEMMEANLWVQTTEAANVHFTFWQKEDKANTLQSTDTVRTQKKDAFAVQLVATPLVPGTTYNYQLHINGQTIAFDYPTTFQSQPLWQYRTDPPNFTLAMGSCTYINEPAFDRPGNPYGGDYQIFTHIDSHNPDLMLWLGDNTYMRPADWYSETGILHRYTHTRSTPEMQPLLASTHNYAIWDDHEFGPNDSDRSYYLKDKTLRAFDLFWANPTVGIPQMEGGITTQFQWGDIDFFLLDNRYFRSPNNCKKCEPELLTKTQIDWLIEALVNSRAPFKMIAIGGQVLNSAPVYENYANHHAKERAYLLRRIEEEGIQNVVFLTGDRHHTEMSQLKNGAGHMLYDITISPLTSGAATSNVDEGNTNRIANTIVTERNFGLLEFSGKRGERQMKISVYNAENELLWESVLQSEKRKQ